MPRKLLVRDLAVERIRESRPKNNPFGELIPITRLYQFNEVTPEQHYSSSIVLQRVAPNCISRESELLNFTEKAASYNFSK
jgi:hypothetical protein